MMFQRTKEEIFELTKEILHTQIKEIPKIPMISSYIDTLKAGSESMEDLGTSYVFINTTNSKVYKKKEIAQISYGNNACYCIDIWIVYEQKLVYIEIDSPGIVKRILWQPVISGGFSSRAYKSLYENNGNDGWWNWDDYRTITELLKPL